MRGRALFVCQTNAPQKAEVVLMRHRWLLCVLLLLAMTAHAGPKEEAQTQKKRGEKLMEEGNYQEALTAFESAKSLSKDPSIELALAGALLKLRKFEEAKASYQLFLDSGKANKQDQKKIKEAISSIESTLKTSVICESEPAGTKVYINSLVDGFVGETPLTFNLPPGEHRLFFEREGYRTKTEKLSISEGEKSSLRTKLEGLPFSASITSDPTGAEVFIAGASRGFTPLTIELESGKHEVKFSLSGYADANSTLEGSAGQKVSLQQKLESAPGSLQFSVKPERAEIKITGLQETFQNSANVQLSTGEYVVQVAALGYQAQELTIAAKPGKTEQVSVSLQPSDGLLLWRAPSDVVVTLAGKAQPKNELLALPPGEYEFSLSAPGKSSYAGTLTLSLGEIAEVTPALSDAPMLSPKQWLFVSGGLLAPWFVVYPVYLQKRAQSNDRDFNARQDNVRQATALLSPLLLGGAISAVVASRIAKKKETSSRVETKMIKELP
jgi:hypothetical protein